MTPLHLAAARGRYKIVEILVDQEANVDIKDPNGVNKCTNITDLQLCKSHFQASALFHTLKNFQA